MYPDVLPALDKKALRRLKHETTFDPKTHRGTSWGPPARMDYLGGDRGCIDPDDRPLPQLRLVQDLLNLAGSSGLYDLNGPGWPSRE